MWKQDDKELDKLSREAAENYSLDQQPGSWDKLLKRLDAELPEKERKRRWVPFFLLFLIVGGGLAYWGLNGGSEEKPQRVVEQSKPKHESIIEAPKPIIETTVPNTETAINLEKPTAPLSVKQKPSKQNLFVYNKPSKSFNEIMNDQTDNSFKKIVEEKKEVANNSAVKKEVKEVKEV
ncbi:MAG TPA: hypothetical protein VJT83_05065, partial [Chitinophagaceae bacterium]|nr:hypothetical protein [Chitinophagaceae bacterium]